MPADEQDAFQWRLRRRIIESGEAYLVGNSIDGRGYLRTTLINPLTTAGDLTEILEIVRRHAEVAAQ
jgi:L-2,4-diaminobutyrate decarboxylase